MRTRLILVITLIIGYFGDVRAQDSFDKAEALFVYNFTRHIGWPATSLSGEFVIGIIGDKGLYDEVVAATSGKSVGSNKIVVKNFATPTEISNSHIIIIGTKFRAKSEEIKTATSGFPTLIINAGDSRITKAAGIGFKMVDEKMKFEMYKTNIKNAGLQLSSQLEKMAVVLD